MVIGKAAERRAQAFRSERANELRSLADDLYKSGVVSDVSPLLQAATECNSRPKNPLGWEYSLSDLYFDTLIPRNTLPKLEGRLSVQLSLSLAGNCEESSHDSFTELAIDIHAEIISPKAPKSICTWHLDKHIYTPDSNEPEFIHPLYHFQYGGYRMASIHAVLGQTLLLEAPRLAHPPMEAILAVDHVVSNYISGGRTLLLDEDSYQRRLRHAQRRWWFPYAQALLQSFDKAEDPSLWTLWPSIVRP